MDSESSSSKGKRPPPAAAADPNAQRVQYGRPSRSGTEWPAIGFARKPEGAEAALGAELTLGSDSGPITPDPERAMADLGAGCCVMIIASDYEQAKAVQERLTNTACDVFITHGMPLLTREGTRLVADEVYQALRNKCKAIQAATESVLTTREQQVLRLLQRGHSYDQVARALGVSVNTVRSHIRALYEKLQVTSKTQAVVKAINEGLVDDA